MNNSEPFITMENQVSNNAILSSNVNATCHRLPVETWRQIFEECVIRQVPRALTPFSWAVTLPKQREHPYTNVMISHVCRYFRHIALSTPILWSTLNLDGSVSEIEAFLGRSEQLPLTITSIRDTFHKSYPRHSNTFATISQRVVSIDTPVEVGSLHRIPSCKSLKSVMLRDGEVWHHSNLDTKRVLNEFESLDTLWWTSISDHPITPSLQKQYSLRFLHLTFRVSRTFILSILQCCPLLENVSARVYTYNFHGTNTQDDEDIHLTRLRDFRVEFTGEDSWLCKLKIPQVLDHFEFSYCHPYPSSSYQQWNVGMKSLTLRGYFDLSSMVSWLARAPGTLKVLALKMSEPNQKGILEALKADGQQILCPQLEQVHIWVSHLFKHQRRPPIHEIYDFEEIIYDLSSSRTQVGLPPLQFTIDGKAVVPKKKVARELFLEMEINNERVSLHKSDKKLYEDRSSIDRWLSMVSSERDAN
jgi:hypothetical protein